MTREEFIQVLEAEGYSYKIEGDKIVVTDKGNVILSSLEELTPGVVFKNGGDVILMSLKEIPSGVVFENRGYVYLRSLKVLPSGVEFRNEGTVGLDSLKAIHPGVVFNNQGNARFPLLIGGCDDWEGNIKRVANKRLLNLMIKRGLFI